MQSRILGSEDCDGDAGNFGRHIGLAAVERLAETRKKNKCDEHGNVAPPPCRKASALWPCGCVASSMAYTEMRESNSMWARRTYKLHVASTAKGTRRHLPCRTHRCACSMMARLSGCSSMRVGIDPDRYHVLTTPSDSQNCSPRVTFDRHENYSSTTSNLMTQKLPNSKTAAECPLTPDDPALPSKLTKSSSEALDR